jgi:hypothetical protein
MGWANDYHATRHWAVVADDPAVDRQRYDTAKRARLPNEVMRNHFAANTALRLLEQGKVVEARQQGMTGINTPTRRSAHTRTVMYLVNKHEGRDDEALADLEAIDPAEPKPRRTIEFLAAEYIRVGRFGAAEKVLDEGERQFAYPAPFLPSRIHLAVARERVEEARAHHEACREAESKQIRVACDEAIKPLAIDGLVPASSPDFLEAVRGLSTGNSEALREWWSRLVPSS